MNLSEYLPLSFSNNRSSKRTDMLNEALIEEFVTLYPQYSNLTWRQEVAIPDAYGATFKVDTVGYKGDTPVVVLLNKNINSNFAQNAKNYANTTIAESLRLLLGPMGDTLEKVYFLNVYPRFAPYFKSSGEVSKVENINKVLQRTDIMGVIDKLNNTLCNNKVEVVSFQFDIEEVNTYTHKSQYQNGVTITNLESFQLT